MRNRIFIGLLVAVWVAIVSVLASKGFFADFNAQPPRIGLALMLPMPFVLGVAFSKQGTQWLKGLAPQWLIYAQAFRILVELVLWLAVRRGELPVQMSFEGRNFDIVAGLLAIPVGYYCYVKGTWPPVIALLFNILGLLLLANVVTISVLSMPTPLRMFHNEPDSSMLARIPFIYIPSVLVPLAYTWHIFSLRQWRQKLFVVSKAGA
jgi:hypothetical protein